MKQYDETRQELKLGAEVIQLLIPHRRPLLMVDTVIAYRRAEQPTLWTKRMVSANEDIFSGHFPDLHLWPGIYTQEGMGQSCHLLQVVSVMQDVWEERGNPPAQVLAGLRNLEMGYRMHPGHRPQDSAFLKDLGRDLARLGMSGSVDIRFHLPVFAGQCIEYTVTRTHVLDRLARFEVEAVSEGKRVASGRITGAIGPLIHEAKQEQ
jgi:3-hydroxyacyl-[acyl-carrier-protein] dehydratase